VQHTLPHLVEAIEAGAPASRQQLFKPCGGRIENERAHNWSLPLTQRPRARSMLEATLLKA
jgi:hypothetical protein